MHKKSKKFHQLAEICSNIIFWETDDLLKVTYVNDTLLEQVGLDRDQIVGMSLDEVLQVNSKKDLTTFLNASPKTKSHDFKIKIKTKEGIQIYLSLSGCVILKKDKIIGYCGICTIETKQIISDKVIKRLQSTNKTIINYLAEALIIFDNNNYFVVVSPEFNNLWKFQTGEVHILPTDEVLAKMKVFLTKDSKNIDLDFSQYKNTSLKTKDVLRFKDGRTIERKSFPYVQDKQIKGRCWYYKDITQQTNLIDRLGKLAFRDSLTKLYNRRWCEKKLKQLLRKANPNKIIFFYLDLDHFKVVNDSCGHLQGDEVLEEISALLLKTVGKKAYLSRLGGDEFGLIILDKSSTQVMKIAKSIKREIANYSYQWKGKLFKIGVSIGIVFVQEKDDFRTIFVHSDEACYLSKQTGRNKIVIYNANQKEFQKTKTELKWYDVIQKAILKGGFELWGQSINDLKNHKKHYEVLLRMKNDQGDLVSPSLFMSSAGRFGMIHTIDKKVISMFCMFYENNYDSISKTLFSINVSGDSLSRKGFLTFTLECLKKHSVDCSKICFEITESEIIKNLKMALKFIHEVRKLGCKISLDDFGKGLTSFSYLKNIPFDFIKIDGQFIKELEEDKINQAVIKSIVYIAEVMEKETIAEHVESEEKFEKIKSLGVNYFQGNYFSEPKQITKLLE